MRKGIQRKAGEKGNALLELAAVSIVIIPLFFGMVGVGVNLGHMNQALEIARDAGHMYAKGVDFSLTGNQNILVNLATGTGMTTNGGNAVLMFSNVIQIFTADCTAAGLTTGQCTNLGQLVFTQRVVVGNSALRASNYGTPPSSIITSTGNINASDYLTKSTALVTGSLSAEIAAAGITMVDGQVIYLTELYRSTPDISYLGTVGSSGVYARAYF